MKIKLTILFLLIVVIAQTQIYNNWNFGFGASINFNANASGGLPTNNSFHAMRADEGNATISDKNGKLLFYTNGRNVFNKLNDTLLNGGNINGHKSSFQSSIIIPHPGNVNLYYIITSDAFENGLVKGYNYHIVDITRDNGKGEVISKNNPLQALGTERLTAVQHANGVDVWVITNDKYSNTFRCWLITCNGILPTAVVSTVGVLLNTYPDMDIGAMKVSPDGTKLCQTHLPDVDLATNTNFCQLFDFNNSTGVVSNAKQLLFPGNYVYSAEFSPNSQLLYLTDVNHQSILQVDAKLPTAAAIIGSVTYVPCGFGIFGIQMAPDKKLYTTRVGNQLGVIQQPNIKGLGCSFKDTAFHLNGAIAQLNLPNVINNAFVDNKNDFTFSYIDSCTGKLQFNAFSNLPNIVTYNWNFGDGTTANTINPIHQYTDLNRLYNVQLIITSTNSCATIIRSQIVVPQGVLLVPNFTYTLQCDSGLIAFTNTSYNEPLQTNYSWNFGDANTSNATNPTHKYSTTGTYNVTLSYANNNSCFAKTKTISITYEKITVTTLPDITINEGAALTLLTTSNGTQYTWTPNSSINDTALLQPTVAPLQDIVYVVKSQNATGCFGIDTIKITVIPQKEIYIPTAFTPNDDTKNDVLVPKFSTLLRNVTFDIYNRFGQKIFTGTPANNYSWNGQYKNAIVNTGAYIFQFTALNIEGKKVLKKGTVMVLY